ncbi:MAG: FAD-dependent oxidoreductase [Methanothrix sp.]|nr:FAD-dependent oxidoreductase [Methanothrix sp.]
MDKFDLIVIGSGAGTHVASQAANEGLKVALLDQGPTGGTCLNNGYIPSKMQYQDLMPVIKSQVIHPTINEVLVRAFSVLEHPFHQHGR